MITRRTVIAIISIVAALALVRFLVPPLQRSGYLWLLAVVSLGPWIVWHFVKQLYAAAMHGYVLTGVPEARVRKEDNRNLYRNNVIAYIALFPVVAAGVSIMLFDALKAEHLIR